MAEDDQQVEFLPGQIHPLTVLIHLPGLRVDGDVQDLQDALALVVAPQDHLDPGQQLHDLKGLHDVILGPQLEPLHPVHHVRLGREEDDGDAQRADEGQKVISVELGQHDIQQHQIEGVALQQIGGLLAVIGAGHVVALSGQIHADQVGDGGLVVHHKDFDHGLTS